jgi:hypothetical protein
MKSTDYQIAGSHYQKLTIQPIDYILANKLPFAEGCIVKYISRWRDKGGVDDLRKIKQFCEFLIEEELKKTPLTTMDERRLPRG